MIDEKNKFISQLSVLRHDAAENRPLVHCITHGITMNDTEQGSRWGIKGLPKTKSSGKEPGSKQLLLDCATKM